ncbi:Rab9 effector protein [Microdochium nivale]|nr:Rab9 effector protein [Microdochium nivale]
MADSMSRTSHSSSSNSKTVRSQKILAADDDQGRSTPSRSHTPGHLSSKSHGGSAERRRKTSDAALRQRSQSAVAKNPFPALPPTQPIPSIATALKSNGDARPTDAKLDAPLESRDSLSSQRPLVMRSTSAIVSKPSSITPTASRLPQAPPQPLGPYVPFPALQDPKLASDVPAAPASGMYWSRAHVSGAAHTPLRAHTSTLVGSNVFVFGGCDSRTCFNELYVLDADSFHWSRPHVVGDTPSPLRAMTCTAVGRKLVVFGGGDGPAYYNDVYVLDTINFRWHKPSFPPDAKIPSPRRAHTACLYRNGIYVFGGGDGVRALNDVWRLDVSDPQKMSWKLISPHTSNSAENRPKPRGYHTANMVGSKLIIFGGSDGGECFNDVWVYDVDTQIWKMAPIPVAFRRLSHTSTIVGSYLFIVGGHDGNEYSNDVLLLNLVTMTWDKRRIYGLPPSGRGYHGTVLYDSRLIMIGGFDGSEVFGDVWILELAVHSYYSQISHFTIEV